MDRDYSTGDDAYGGGGDTDDSSQPDSGDETGAQGESDVSSDDGSGAQAVTQAATDDHRAALGSLVQNLQSRGIDVDSLAQQAGLDSADVNNLEHDDLLTLSKYVAQSHPELTQQVFSRFPLAQSLLGRFLG